VGIILEYMDGSEEKLPSFFHFYDRGDRVEIIIDFQIQLNAAHKKQYIDLIY